MKKIVLVMFGVLACIGCNEDKTFQIVTQDSDLIAIYRLKNESGIETTNFKMGENLIIELSVTNNTDNDIMVSDEASFMTTAFVVYNKAGEQVGAAYDACPEVLHGIILEAHKTYIWSYPWLLNPAVTSSHPFMKLYDKAPLPPGEYMTEYIFTQQNKKQTIYFEVTGSE